MKLKIKFLEWSAGLPVAMLNKDTAKKLGIHSKDRVLIKTLDEKPRKVSTIIDTVEDLVKEKEIAVSSELRKILDVKNKEKIDVKLAPIPKSMSYVIEKLNGKRLNKEKINAIIKDISRNSFAESEIALFISALHTSGMDNKEILIMIDSFLENGHKLPINNKLAVNKHCIGGVPGNRTTPLVVSICAAGGLIFPKTSSRAITSPAGTADVIESIAKIDFSVKQIMKIIKKTKACMIWGGGLGMVPADSKIIKVEKVLKIDVEPLLLASVLSKKLAEGSKHILIDIPYGKNAKVCKRKALELKKKFEHLDDKLGVQIKVILTSGNQPIGNGIGPILELNDVIDILNPDKKGPKDLEEKSLLLSGLIFEMVGKKEKGRGIEFAKEILYSGKAFEKFKQIIKAQKGSIKYKKPARHKKDFFASKSGKIIEMHNKKISSLARIAGCPVDKFAGIYFYYKLGNKVKKGEKIYTIYSESKSRLAQAIKYNNSERPILVK